MTVGIANIIGIDKDTAAVLKQYGITTVKRLYDATRTSKARDELSIKTGFSLKNIELWAMQGELLRNTNMSPEDAFDFMRAGIYSVEEISLMDAKEILDRVKKYNKNSLLDLKQIHVLKQSRIRQAAHFENIKTPIWRIPGQEASEEKAEASGSSEVITEEKGQRITESSTNDTSSYSDLSEVITELGRGIAQAQHQLDCKSLEIQKQIMNEPMLAAMGLNATWYVIPEVDFELKMEYVVTEEKTEEGTIRRKGIKIFPHNATYDNYFNSTRTEESTLRLKFVPVPAPVKALESMTMPDLIGLSQEEAKAVLEENSIVNYQFVEEQVETVDGKDGIVIKQSIPKEQTFYLYEKPVITVKSSNTTR